MILISIIIPIYRGKRFLPSLLDMIRENAILASDMCEIEVVFVSDLPEETITDSDIYSQQFTSKLIVHETNMGIHRSRVDGLIKASGNYVVFLDQDDKIEPDYIVSQLKKIGRHDLIVCNGYAVYPDHVKHLYKYRFMQMTVKHVWFYLTFSSRIISPGQCLIRKSSIPKAWYSHIIHSNGADDLFLWLLLFAYKARFAINRDHLYSHEYTGSNASLDDDIMELSRLEVLNISGEDIPEAYRKFSGRKQSGILKPLTSIIENINSDRNRDH